MASIFTRIINRDIPSYIVYEDEHTIAFLTIEPVRPGHTLVVPKCEVDMFYDVPEPYYTSMWQTAKTLAPHIQQATGAERCGIKIAGFEVSHCHIHLIPAYTEDDLNTNGTSTTTAALTEAQNAIITAINHQQ